MTVAGTSKALEAWTGLNDRQQGTLAVIYQLDQETEAARREASARGHYDDTPAAIWRRLDFALDPSGLGTTVMQQRLISRGWHNQGNGSTMAALADRGLIRRGGRAHSFGTMLTVTLTPAGRAAAKAGTTLPGTPKAALSHRSWEVLVLLWIAGLRGNVLKWGHSTTIDNVLIGKHVPPLAEFSDEQVGYRITDRGRWFYREHWAAHVKAHPDIRAPHPDGADAEPWPSRADDILSAHWHYYRALCVQWEAACTVGQAAGTEASAAPPELPGILPPAVAGQAIARHQLWTSTARQRADVAAAHASDVGGRAERAARVYAVNALAAFRAAVLYTSPLDVLQPPGEADGWDEQRLAPPAETGIHVIDAEAKKLYAAAVGAPLPRRGPAPVHRRRRYAAAATAKPELPGSKLAALADYLRGHADGGALMRRLHPVSEAGHRPV